MNANELTGFLWLATSARPGVQVRIVLDQTIHKAVGVIRAVELAAIKTEEVLVCLKEHSLLIFRDWRLRFFVSFLFVIVWKDMSFSRDRLFDGPRWISCL